MNKRTLLAIVLIGLVMVAWTWNQKRIASNHPAAPVVTTSAEKPPSPADNALQTPPPAPPDPTPAVPATTPAAEAPAAAPKAAFVAADQETIDVVDNLTLKNAQLTSRWTNRFTGACLDVTFTDFYRTVKHEVPLTLIGDFGRLVPAEGPERELTAMVLEFPELSKALADMKMRVVSADDNAIVFSGRILRHEADGALHDYLEITKTVRPSPDAFEMLVEVSVKNLTGAPVPLQYNLRALEGISIEGSYAADANARLTVLSESGRPVLKTGKKLEAAWTEGTGNVRWGGIDDRYFAALVYVEAGGAAWTMQSGTVEPIKVRLAHAGAGAMLSEPVPSARVTLVGRSATLVGGESNVLTFHLFAGPKRVDVLDRHANLGLSNLVDYGMLGLGVVLATPIVWLLRGLYFVVRNYGIAILIMTVIIRVLLHPLTKKGQVAMTKMQRLRPKIQELQKRFKNDKQKLAQEQMKLFRESGVSPMSGCLPMLLQMPVLLALFSALRLAFELRQAPFGLWIGDLSLPDSVALPVTLPLVGDAINILPILMSAAMLVQQILQPKAEDEQSRQQQKMMMILPFVFVFMFYGFPSGLNLYWFASTVIGIGEQWYIKRHIDETLGPAPKA